MSTQAAAKISAGHEASADHAEVNYISIFIYLTILTGLELAVVYAPLVKAMIVAILVGLAWAKAALVAMYFMHLRFERRTMAVIALIPVVLIMWLGFMLMPDLTSRNYAHTEHHEQVKAVEPSEAPQASAPAAADGAAQPAAQPAAQQ